jgi:hypothetical protein
MRSRLALCLALFYAGAARGELYRCEDASGAVRLTRDPHGCANAVVQAPSASRPPASGAPAPDGEGIFPPRPTPAWEVMIELPELPDGEERALGLLGSAARHYSRATGAVSEMCTLEVWSFARPDQAERARAELARPGWWGRAADAQLVLAHGVRLERERGSRVELSAACESLAEAAHARALATLRTGRPVK